MKIAICGASDYIGSHLTDYYTSQHVMIVPLSKALFAPDSFDRLVTTIMGCDVIINLAGVTLNHCWNENYKKEIYDSRVATTRILVNAINSLGKKPSVFISTSAVGYYSSNGSYRESNAMMGGSFLATVCHDWEQEAKRVSSDVRSVITRFGVVLSNDGGVFPKMIKSTKMGVMTKIGSGDQYLSWIEIHDLIHAIDFIIKRDEIHGVINLCAPTPITNSDFAHLVAKKMRARVITVPIFVIRTIMGESSTLVTSGQKVYPERLIKYGYKFGFPTIGDFLDSI